MEHKGAIIDLDDVLFPTSEYTGKVMNYSVAAMIRQGLKAEQEEALEMLGNIRKREGSNAYNHFDLLCQVYNPHEDNPQRIVQAGVAAYHSLRERLWVPQDENDPFLNFLEAEGIRMSIVSKGLKNKQWFKIIKLGIVDYFVQRDEFGDVSKGFVYIMPDDHPDPTQGKQELVGKAMKDMEADPARSFVIDDRPYGIVAAKKAGVRYGIRLKRGKYSTEKCPKDTDKVLRPDFEVANLEQAIDVISEHILTGPTMSVKPAS
ncbi:HAD hydrolase-like protein [Candidatus Woesearchaeota archaeon]|nr:HAD hydrolase-like protein [Candidatus Woesearchaeota archaeon]